MKRSDRLQIMEAALLAAGRPLSTQELMSLFSEDVDCPDEQEMTALLQDLERACAQRSYELSKVGRGYRLQIREELAGWMSKLWSEKPPVYSRVVLETLALIAYKQPVTRADIESVRGTPVSSHTVRILEEREWIKVVGYRDVPGRPALYGTTPQFLDYFNLGALEDLPPLPSGEQRENSQAHSS